MRDGTFNRALFGAKIEYQRKKAMLTQSELAAKVGCTQGTICNYENGRFSPDIIMANKIACVLGTTLGELMEGTY